MKRKKALAVMALTACLAVTTLAGCGSSGTEDTSDKGSGEETTITLGVFETDNITADIWQDMIDSFEEDNPGIKVEKVLATGDDRQAFWRTMLSGGNFPDIVIEAELLATMDGVFAEVPQDVQEIFDESLLTEYNGKCITVPSFRQYKMQCYYNKQVFADLGLEEPQTWDEFIEVCETIKAAGLVPLMCGGTGDIWATGEPFWIAEGDTALLSAYPDFNEGLKSGEYKWNNDITVNVLSTWQDMVNKGYYYEGAMSLSYSQAADEFKKGSAAMIVDGSWMAAGLDAEGNEDFGVFALPTMDGSKLTISDASYWGVSESSENKDAAFEFIKYVFDENQEPYKAYLQSDGLYSTTKKEVTYEQGPVTTKMLENVDGWERVQEIVKLPGDNATPNGMQSYMDKSFQNIFNGADVQTEVEGWDTEYQRLLDAQ